MPEPDCKPLPKLSEKDIRRFHAKLDERGPDECWLWTASLDLRGYGTIQVNDRNLKIHRVAWLLHYGHDPFPFLVLHSCDVRYLVGDRTYRRCGNPAHLWLGDTKDNICDMVQKHRVASGRRQGAWTHPEMIRRGSAHPNSKLTEQQVLEIPSRVASGESQAAIAKDLGISTVHLADILKGKAWKHINR